ncbi:hypothetical protein HHK36_015845 [Tetracentron sinense]|uniref:60S ribosomal protein L32 n=1 Tax=Tetracentron sinense TaxID=13715 RepID=A0A835DE11_TETSI|nr:hypothetical protein HHK36_015845 [Tetracentron sinense]
MDVPLLTKKTVIKKRVKKFKRPQSDRKISVKPSSRRPKGIESRVKRKFKRCTLMLNIGYGSDKKNHHYIPNDFMKFVVHNVKAWEVLMMHHQDLRCRNWAYCLHLEEKGDSHATQLDVVVTNKMVRLRS